MFERKKHTPPQKRIDSLIGAGTIVEGNVNRLKTLKRQMYGRASFALLRQRILLN